MLVNQTLANYSDLSFKTAFVIYVFALILAIVYYAKQSQVLFEPARELVGAGGPAASEPAVIKDVGAEKFAGMAQSMIWLAIIFHAVSVVLRGMSASRFPFGNLYEYVAMVTLVAMAIAAWVIQRRELRVMWPWVLTPVIALLFYGGVKLYAASAPVVPALQSFWFPIHVSTVSIGAGVGMISGMASLLYILRMYQPKGEEQGIFGAIMRPLPSAKTLDGLAYKAAVWALPVFGLGIALGAIWAESAWGRFWGWDPKETISLVTWVLYAAYLHARATSGWKNSAAAWINIVAFGMMVFNLFFINMVVSGLHSYAGLN
ncbi:c-type cytochrome biogenesis protein CcsB [Corynebacterium hindlerae]|uniref:C-type cytochrome biogenesis protein CcsB n=1 Tax=Corynebacterium hindlerae TaxID=699041 RepID=A0A7G5FHX8_9CORY|nr:c-type cytochrome biogenesis protein CcsB [Corynebacterium hindlerae]QMV86219.1 c-type cytochrome biogenesis protein CcsB [Corynebacterium hindlerae]